MVSHHCILERSVADTVSAHFATTTCVVQVTHTHTHMYVVYMVMATSSSGDVGGDDVMFSYHWAIYNQTRRHYFEEFRHVEIPVFGKVHQNAASGAKYAIYVCLV